MEFLDLHGGREAVTSQTGFQGQNLTAEVLSSVMLVCWVRCITMSRESQRLERKLGVGTR
jgi:general L-amino acid transport system permease protein